MRYIHLFTVLSSNIKKAGLEQEKAALLAVNGTQFRAYVSDRGHASLDEDHGSR